MEAKLAAYRAEKKRQFEEQKRQEWLAGAYLSAKDLLTRRKVAPSDGMETSDAVAMETEPMLGRTSPVQSKPAAEEGAPEGWGWSALDWLMLALKVALYLTLFAIACHYQFGAAFIVVTAIPIIYFSTSTRGRRRGEASAYSVFNPGCEAIDGTLTGEQLGRELMYGPGAM